MEQQDDGAEGATMCFQASVCIIRVHLLAFVCTFLLVTGWTAAVLESLLTESVGSAGYFYPLACVREQVGALWDWNKVTWWRLPLCDYLRLLWPNVKVREWPFHKDTACDASQTSAAEWKSSFPQHNIPPGKEKLKLILKKRPPNVVFPRRLTIKKAAWLKIRKSIKILILVHYLSLQGLNLKLCLTWMRILNKSKVLLTFSTWCWLSLLSLLITWHALQQAFHLENLECCMSGEQRCFSRNLFRCFLEASSAFTRRHPTTGSHPLLSLLA